eukprot:EG_transcript_2555
MVLQENGRDAPDSCLCILAGEIVCRSRSALSLPKWLPHNPNAQSHPQSCLLHLLLPVQITYCIPSAIGTRTDEHHLMSRQGGGTERKLRPILNFVVEEMGRSPSELNGANRIWGYGHRLI